MEFFPQGVLIIKRKLFLSAAGTAVGIITGLLGTGGGSILSPILGKHAGISEQERFPSCIAITAPICVISLLFSDSSELSFGKMLPYLLGSVIGGIVSGRWGIKIPTPWLHRILGIFMLWGGLQILW